MKQYYNFQMLGIELTEKEKKIWSEMGDKLVATTQIRHLSLQYYLLYRQNLQKAKLFSDDNDKINNLLQIAYFISEKMQVTYNLKGERVGGITFSINEIIKKNTNFEDFIYHMKEMMKVITIEDKFVQQEIENCLKKFKFTMTFHHKFVSTFNKIKPGPSHTVLSQSLLWLLFILLKQGVPSHNQNDIIEITCLIASVFIYYVKQSTENFPNDYQLDDVNYGGKLKKQSISHVLLQYFRLKDFNKFQQVYDYMNNQLQTLKQATGFSSFFLDKNIEFVYRKLDIIYMKRLGQSNIDERHFLKERINNVMNANRFTPFGGRRNPQKNKNNSVPNQILSHRVLNFQKQQEQKQIFDKDSQSDIKKSGSSLLKKLAQNKTPAQKTPLIKTTPMTNAMEMYNWILQKSNYHKFDQSQLLKYIKNDEKVLRLINGLWKDICSSEAQKGNNLNEKEKLAILALSTQIIYFVTNSMQSLEKIGNDLQITWFEIWVKIDCILNYDTRMPVSIKIHLLSIDTTLITKQLWRRSQEYIQIFKDSKFRTEVIQFDRLYRRIIHQIVYQIYFLSKKLNFSEQTMSSVFMLSQYAITEHSQLLLYRTLHHIILCSVYAVCKAEQTQMPFYTLLLAFQELNNLGKQDYQQLTQQIYREGEERVDLRTFYNEQFVKKTRPVLVQLKYQANSAITTISNKKNLISSPLKDLLPKNIVALADRTNKTPLQTPLTLALQAYHQSPLLKQRRIKNIGNCIDGKRILEKKNDLSKQQTIKQTSMLINQKWRTTKSPDKKINTTVKKGHVQTHEDNPYGQS